MTLVAVPLQRILLVAAASLHLASVALFIWTGFPEKMGGSLASALRTYKNLSGTFRDYTFFAPAVASDLKAGFLLTDVNGEESFINFVATSREVGFRYNCIIASCMRDRRGRDLFAQSWAALLLGTQLNAKQVAVVVKALDMPSMHDYRDGIKPEWKTVYVGEFARQEKGESDRPISQR